MKAFIAAFCAALMCASCANAQVPSDDEWRQAETLCNNADNCSALEKTVAKFLAASSDPDDIKSVFWAMCQDAERHDPEACAAGQYVYGRLRAQTKSQQVKLFASDMISHMETVKVLWQHVG